MKNLPFFAVWFILIGCFFALNANNEERFNEVDSLYNVTAVNLDADLKKSSFVKVLVNNNYVNDEAEASFIADFMIEKLANDTAPQIPDAVLDLKTRRWQIPADRIDSTAPLALRQRLAEVSLNSGWTAEVDSLYRKGGLSHVVDAKHGGQGTMTVYAYDKLPEQDKIPAENVIVRLQKYVRFEKEKRAVAVPLAYAATDKNGKAIFRGLCLDSSYSVLPIREGVSFGSEKGTTRGTLAEHIRKNDTEFSFTSYPLSVRMFRNQTLTNMRDDGLITVRTPQAFQDMITAYMAAFLVGWLIVFFVGNNRKRKMDNTLAAGIMLLSGLSMLLMFGINDPLTQRVLGNEMAQGCLAGIVAILSVLVFDFRKFFQNLYKVKFDLPFACVEGIFNALGYLGFRRLLKPLAKKWNSLPVGKTVSDACSKAYQMVRSIPGSGYLLAALALGLCLKLFGQQVGGMTVNIDLGFIKFQPSEIIKFLFVMFISAFFFEKGDSIIAYSEPALFGINNGPWVNLKRKLKACAVMLAGMMGLMGLYVFNSDMGPALVVALTFIVLYSLMKSRIAFSRTSGESEGMQLLHSDLSMLFIGILTFTVALLLGHYISGEGGMAIFALLWFMAWMAYGWFVRRQVFESPVMFNLLVTFFVFGERIFRALHVDSIAQRLADRSSMCINTWGTLGGDPTVNTQVAEGQWALATGGLTGQGLGNAQAHYIPAFHTDMILQSIGEIMGFIGVATVIILLSILLRRAVLAGYRSGHTFLLYLCCGIAVVTGVQLFIIALGSLGIIPLTGVSVPFFSYGRVSLFFNMLAFGIILSVSSRPRETQRKVMKQYNLTVGMLTLSYSALALFVLVGMARYQLGPEREDILIREVYVYDTSGAAVVKYNPRIEYLTSKMNAGNIYDRKGVLLATSDPQKMLDKNQADRYRELGIKNIGQLAAKVQTRYYPFGEHLFFMVGDMNNKLYFPSVNHMPFGYLAEARHMSWMRGYSNSRMLEDGTPDTVSLKSEKYRFNRFMPAEDLTIPKFQLRDYSVLLDFLKEGNNSDLLRKYNEGESTGIKSNLKDKNGRELEVRPQDIHLTVDAELQMKLQNGIPAYFKNEKARFRDGVKTSRNLYTDEYRNFERFSIVVMDAVNGDLLASANWPLPDYDRIEENNEKNNGNYSDSNKPVDWQAFTERDLGLTRPTNPGSTAKVISSLAALMHLDSIGKGKVEDLRYKVYRKNAKEDERIHVSQGAEPDGWVDMDKAIVKSSNVYFINLVNDKRLYGELAEIYGKGGLRVQGIDAYGYQLSPLTDGPSEKFMQTVTGVETQAAQIYDNYVEQRNTKSHELKKDAVVKKMAGENGKYTHGAWYWSWGEGTLDATPAAMARIAATAATGYMPVTRFCSEMEEVQRYQLVQSQENIDKLRSYMKKETVQAIHYSYMGGKTGTPEESMTGDAIQEKLYKQAKRAGRRPKSKEQFKRTDNINDGWYICFIDNATIATAVGDKLQQNTSDPKPGTGKIAVAVRIERTMAGGSGYAKDVVDKMVIPTLQNMGYIPL